MYLEFVNDIIDYTKTKKFKTQVTVAAISAVLILIILSMVIPASGDGGDGEATTNTIVGQNGMDMEGAFFSISGVLVDFAIIIGSSIVLIIIFSIINKKLTTKDPISIKTFGGEDDEN